MHSDSLKTGTAGPDRGLTVEIEHYLGSFHLQVSFTTGIQNAVLFGPSGAGKTSVLRAIAGLLRPDHSTIRFGGETLTDKKKGVFVPPQQRGFGLVSQRPALFPHLTVRQNVAFGLMRSERHGYSTEEQVESMLRLVYAAPFRDRYPRELSGGEQQRVALARALAPQPRLLLLDEPLTGMNAGLKQEVLGNLLGYLQEHAIPVVSITHDLPEIFAMNSEVVMLEEGKVTGQGSAQELLAGERDRLLQQLEVQKIHSV